MSVWLVVLARVVRYQLPSQCVSLASGFSHGGSVSIILLPSQCVGLAGGFSQGGSISVTIAVCQVRLLVLARVVRYQ